MDLCLLLLLVVLLGGCASVQGDMCTASGCQCTGQVHIDLSGFFNYPYVSIRTHAHTYTHTRAHEYAPTHSPTCTHNSHTCKIHTKTVA